MLLGGLAPATRRSYLCALRDFDECPRSSHTDATTMDQLDRAACVYVSQLNRSKGEYLVAALLKAYPKLRYTFVLDHGVYAHEGAKMPS